MKTATPTQKRVARCVGLVHSMSRMTQPGVDAEDDLATLISLIGLAREIFADLPNAPE